MQERNTLDEPDRINKKKLLEENKENPNNEEKNIKFYEKKTKKKNISTEFIQSNVQSENSNLKKIDFMIDDYESN